METVLREASRSEYNRLLRLMIYSFTLSPIHDSDYDAYQAIQRKGRNISDKVERFALLQTFSSKEMSSLISGS